MKTRSKHILTGLLFAILTPFPSFSQVLEVVPDNMKPVVERTAHIGTCYTGSTGLVTIPTPDFQKTKIGVSYKSGVWDQDIMVNGVKTELEKDEFTASIRVNLDDNLELTANHLKYERKSKPTTANLDYKEDTVAFGMKYSAHHGDKDICMGFTFAPMSAEELNMADIEQIENLRNAYLTISESVAENMTGFLNLTSAFTKKQEIDFGNGVIQKVDRKDILIGAFGLEYSFANTASVFCEYKVGNYRDIFAKESARHRFHAGIRLGAENIQAELLGMNLSEDNPTMVVGGSIAF
jgi:predicted porin